MQNKKKKQRSFLKAGGLIGFIVIGLAVGSLYLASVSDVVEEHIVEVRKTTLIPVGDYNPGDNSGYFYFMVKNHSANPTVEYASNVTNGTINSNCYEWSDFWNTTATGETPYSTTFDIVIKTGVTNEDGQWTSNNTWNPDYNWLLLTCADLSIGADTNMTEIEIANTSSYAWYHYYDDNGGSGYTITEGQSFNITSAKFYVQRIT